MIIRTAEPSDAPSIAKIERAYIDCPWTESQIKAEIESGAVFWVAICDGMLCGYISGEVTVDECEISNIAVAEEYRRQGVGKALLLSLINDATGRGATSVFLLVRDGNIPAISLYTHLGFECVGLRKNYYKGKDAHIMRLRIPPRE